MYEMTLSEWHQTDPAYKTIREDGTRAALRLDPETGSTVSEPVKILETAPGDLANLPTLSQGQTADLKIDTGQTRVWLERCGPEDGETHQVTVERLKGGRWEVTERLYPHKAA